ncbi:mitochondrial large subunit ribosomal protein-domain-containing protein [Aspergillus avenaceus]|uniref:Large ribosomal subunit protein mL49 n=1 Tax=Aspergillus avenaceus TaxID=36643 RepID=A0A5N6U254_ASPAV|nr:mitochondrial large subunit ribosomal protein-domain-containing protein [Aspergillus avenaceus]
MASFLQSRPVCSAVCKQSTALPSYLSHSVTTSSRTCSSFPTLSSSRLINSQYTPLQRLNSRSGLPTQQSRTFLVQLNRQSQTLKETTSTSAPSVANLQLTNLPYFVRRTASNQLPVYLVTKAGGTKQQTKIQKTEGDVDTLRNDLAQYLGLESSGSSKSSDITINRLNGHIIIKGWRKPEILKFLQERNF